MMTRSACLSETSFPGHPAPNRKGSYIVFYNLLMTAQIFNFRSYYMQNVKTIKLLKG